MPVGGVSVWVAALVGALSAGLARIVSIIPNILGALVILLLGWIIGKAIQALVTRGLRAVHFNDITERAGINNALQRADIKTGPSAILGVLAYWFVFLFAISLAVSMLGVPALTAIMAAVVLYLPRVFVALLVLVAGAWGASILARLTRASAETAGVSYAGILSGIVQGAVLFFTFAIALDTLGLSFPFLTTAFAIVLGSLALAAAIAFGLGGRDYAADILAGRELRSVFHKGDRLMADNIDGTVENIQPTLTLIHTSRGDVAVQNSDLMKRHVTRASGTMEGGDTGMMGRAA